MLSEGHKKRANCAQARVITFVVLVLIINLACEAIYTTTVWSEHWFSKRGPTFVFFPVCIMSSKWCSLFNWRKGVGDIIPFDQQNRKGTSWNDRQLIWIYVTLLLGLLHGGRNPLFISIWRSNRCNQSCNTIWNLVQKFLLNIPIPIFIKDHIYLHRDGI